MANKGPDGQDRCGFLRGKKCEQKRYEQSLNTDLKSAQVKETINGIGAGSNTVIIAVIVVVVLIGIALYLKFRKK
ncbi:hypothetical protein JZU46_01135 [bacterium]|nr:hypothetical protein [bacterium]